MSNFVFVLVVALPLNFAVAMALKCRSTFEDRCSAMFVMSLVLMQFALRSMQILRKTKTIRKC